MLPSAGLMKSQAAKARFTDPSIVPVKDREATKGIPSKPFNNVFTVILTPLPKVFYQSRFPVILIWILLKMSILLNYSILYFYIDNSPGP